MSSYYDALYKYVYPPTPDASEIPWLLKLTEPITSTVDGAVSAVIPTLYTRLTQAQIVIGAFGFFTSIYLIEARLQSWKSPKERHEWCVLFPSQIHAGIVSFLGLVCILSPDMYADMAGSATSSAILGVCIICGYMLGDLVSLCFNVKFDGFPFVIHAFASLTPYVTCILTSRYVTFCGSALIAESSTVLLNLRVMMIKTGRGQGAFFEAIQAAFFLLFIFVRIFVCSFVLFPMWYSELSALWSDRGFGEGLESFQMYSLTVTFVVMNALNWTWSYQMIMMATGAERGKKENKEKSEKKKEPMGEKKVTFVNWWLVKPMDALGGKGKVL